jgi:hypothetical protein
MRRWDEFRCGHEVGLGHVSLGQVTSNYMICGLRSSQVKLDEVR